MWNDWIFVNNLVVLNNGKPTFVRGESRSHIDTLVNESYARKIAGWEVLEDNLYTFHRYIVFETGIKVSKIGRKKVTFNKEAYTRQISNLQEDDTTEFQDFRQKIINAYTSSSSTENVTYTVPYWWNDEMQSKRAECFRLRRTAQRYRTPQHTENYKRAKKELGREIKRAKHSCWHNLCTALEDDVWGEAYRIATKTLRTETPYSLCAKKRKEIANTLFPAKPPQQFTQNNVNVRPVDFSAEEIAIATKSIKLGKAAGPDGVPPEAIKIIIEKNPEMVRRIFNSSRSKCFP
ncbi:uncharacterized protein [Diabrotica undecimpunctata]|uniref:uncharacterized protein n=1 Tax=Diabrotica undecimpunctata TaxID=50387 RepID=UPI003B63DFFA